MPRKRRKKLFPASKEHDSPKKDKDKVPEELRDITTSPVSDENVDQKTDKSMVSDQPRVKNISDEVDVLQTVHYLGSTSPNHSNLSTNNNITRECFAARRTPHTCTFGAVPYHLPLCIWFRFVFGLEPNKCTTGIHSPSAIKT